MATARGDLALPPRAHPDGPDACCRQPRTAGDRTGSHAAPLRRAARTGQATARAACHQAQRSGGERAKCDGTTTAAGTTPTLVLVRGPAAAADRRRRQRAGRPLPQLERPALAWGVDVWATSRAGRCGPSRRWRGSGVERDLLALPSRATGAVVDQAADQRPGDSRCGGCGRTDEQTRGRLRRRSLWWCA